jgi:hypothetical protein
MKGVAELLLLLVTQLIDTTKIKKEDDCSDCLPTTRQTVYPGIGSDVADATETALPVFQFIANCCMSLYLMYHLYRLRFEYLTGLLRMWR